MSGGPGLAVLLPGLTTLADVRGQPIFRASIPWRKLLDRSRISPCPFRDPAGLLLSLCGVANVVGDSPGAAIAALGEGLDASRGCWAHADPVRLLPDRSQLVLEDPRLLEVPAEWARQAVDALNQTFGEDGMAFFAPDPRRWYLRLSECPALVTHSPGEAAGRPVGPFLPTGPDARDWARLLNEAQMLLHSINPEALTAGVNSLWLHGFGRLPREIRTVGLSGGDEDPLLRGLRRLATAMDESRPDELEVRYLVFWTEDAADAAELLVRLNLLGDELLAGLAQGQWPFVDVYGLDGQSFHCDRWDAWRFWRRSLRQFPADG